MPETVELVLQAMVADLEDAWNAGDGVAFAASFEEDADFVNIFGIHGKGKQAIADAHNMIFRTVYAGSHLETRVRQARNITRDVALVHLESCLKVPQGPMAGEMHSVPSVLFRRSGEEWTIVSFHNTLVQPPPAMHNNGQPR